MQIFSFKYGIAWGIITLLSGIISYFVSAHVIDMLAPSFDSEKDLNQSAKLVAYSLTPAWIAGIFYAIPALTWLSIVGLYAVYIFYLGLGPMKKTIEDKKIIYMIVAGIVMIVVLFVINTILAKIVYSIIGDPISSIFWSL
jgi:hypothetical protein